MSLIARAAAVAVIAVMGTMVLRAPTQNQVDWSELVARLQELPEEYMEARESERLADRARTHSLIEAALAKVSTLGTAGKTYVPALEALRAAVMRDEQPAVIDGLTDALIARLLAERAVTTHPTAAIDLERGQQTYAASCAVCHGSNGDANTPIAATLDPAPVNFHEDDVMNPLSPYRVFNAVTHGVHGTAMPSFKTTLTEADRWNVAFFAFTFRHASCDQKTAGRPLALLATSTDSRLTADFGEHAVPCLRRLESSK